jgi:hypothetical protein
VGEDLKVRDPRKWVRHWFLPNPKNLRSLIPMDAGVTLTNGLNMLIGMPYQAVANHVGRILHGLDLVAYPTVSDSLPCGVLIIQPVLKKVYHVFKVKAAELRFASLGNLNAWLAGTATVLQSRIKEVASNG